MGDVVGRRFYVSVTVVSAVIMTLLFGGTAQAQQQAGQENNGNGLRIAPVRQDLEIGPGKSQTVDVYVENITNSPAELRGVVNDFTASGDESGKPRILFDEKDFAPSHGLKRYVSPISNFKLAPKEQKILKVTITIPADAAGGGYYGAVRFLPTGSSSGKNVSLSASVGSLILVTVPGDVKEQLGIASVNVSRGEGKASTLYTSGNDLKATIRFKNAGNIQVAPFGKFNLKKSGKEIASYEINNTEPRGVILPDSVRRFEVGLGDKAQSFGKYTLEGNFGYGNRGQLLSASTSFYVIPMPFVILGGLIVALLLFAIFALPKMIKKHDRNLIKKMRK